MKTSKSDRLFPLFVSLQGKECLVIGGGTIAYRKAKALVESGARVTVVSPAVTASLRRLKNIRIRMRKFRPQDLKASRTGPWLVIAATNDEKINEEIFRLGQARRLWINTVDKPAACNFIFPGVFRRGELTLAVSTGGASPALARFIRERLKEFFGHEYALAASALHRMRPLLLRWPLVSRRRFLSRLLTKRGFHQLRRHGPKKWHQALRHFMASGSTMGRNKPAKNSPPV